jgi:hypothetical protein
VDAYGTENDSNGVIVGSYKSGFGATTLLNNNDTVTVMFGGSLREISLLQLSLTKGRMSTRRRHGWQAEKARLAT